MLDRIEVAPGVFRRMLRHSIVHSGAGDDLAAAGLVKRDLLPGQPGNPRSVISLDPEGRRIGIGGAAHGKHGPGSQRIIASTRSGVTTFEIWTRMSEAEVDAMEAARKREAARWPFPVVVGGIPA